MQWGSVCKNSGRYAFHKGAYYIFSVISLKQNNTTQHNPSSPQQQLWIYGLKLSPCNSCILQYYRLAPGELLRSLCSQGLKAVLIG